MTTTAPPVRTINQLAGSPGNPLADLPDRSAVLGIIATAEHIHEGLTDNARLARDNEMLRAQLDALLDTDRGELLTRNEELKAEVDTLTGKLIAAHDDLKSLRNQLSSLRSRVPVVAR